VSHVQTRTSGDNYIDPLLMNAFMNKQDAMPAFRTPQTAASCSTSPPACPPPPDVLRRIRLCRSLVNEYTLSFLCAKSCRRSKRESHRNRLTPPPLRVSKHNEYVYQNEGQENSEGSPASDKEMMHNPYSPVEAWVVCAGCYRNLARPGYYCWACGFDC
jgi:hypothetical protein